MHNVIRYNAQWLFKVIQMSFTSRINRKRVCDFLLVISSNLGPILERLGDRMA